MFELQKVLHNCSQLNSSVFNRHILSDNLLTRVKLRLGLPWKATVKILKQPALQRY